MKKEIDLAKKYIEYTDDKDNADKTFDDFFKAVGVKKRYRSNFLVASILKQSREILNKE